VDSLFIFNTDVSLGNVSLGNKDVPVKILTCLFKRIEADTVSADCHKL